MLLAADLQLHRGTVLLSTPRTRRGSLLCAAGVAHTASAPGRPLCRRHRQPSHVGSADCKQSSSAAPSRRALNEQLPLLPVLHLLPFSAAVPVPRPGPVPTPSLLQEPGRSGEVNRSRGARDGALTVASPERGLWPSCSQPLTLPRAAEQRLRRDER